MRRSDTPIPSQAQVRGLHGFIRHDEDLFRKSAAQQAEGEQAEGEQAEGELAEGELVAAVYH